MARTKEAPKRRSQNQQQVYHTAAERLQQDPPARWQVVLFVGAFWLIGWLMGWCV